MMWMKVALLAFVVVSMVPDVWRHLPSVDTAYAGESGDGTGDPSDGDNSDDASDSGDDGSDGGDGGDGEE